MSADHPGIGIPTWPSISHLSETRRLYGDATRIYQTGFLYNCSFLCLLSISFCTLIGLIELVIEGFPVNCSFLCLLSISFCTLIGLIELVIEGFPADAYPYPWKLQTVCTVQTSVRCPALITLSFWNIGGYIMFDNFKGEKLILMVV